MEENITPDRLANAVRMDSSFNGYYLFVEGPTDICLYKKFVNNSNIKVRAAFGCLKVREVLNILNAQGIEKSIGIIDVDFRNIYWSVDEAAYGAVDADTNNLFVTDDHDIETMAIKTKALDCILDVYSTEERVESFEKQNGPVRSVLIELGEKIADLKLANKIYNLGLVFKPKEPEGNQIKYSKFICDKKLIFKGTDALIQAVINYSVNRGTSIKSKEIIIEKLNEVSENKYEWSQLLNGHDLVNILFLLLKKVLKSKNKGLHDYKCLEASLMLAFDYTEFNKTNLYNDLYAWSKLKGVELFAV